MVSSDNSVYAQLTDVVGPKAIVKTAHEPRDPQPARTVLLDRPRVGRGEPARDGARLRDARERGPARRRRGVREPPPRRRERRARPLEPVEANAPIPKQVMDESHAELLTDILEDVVQSGTGNRAAIPGPRGRRQDGHDGQLRRRVVRRLHAGARRRGLGRLPGRPAADAHRVQRRAGRRRDASGADLEGVRREGPGGRGPFLRRSALPRRRVDSGSSAARASGSSTTGTAAARGSSRTSPVRGPTRRPTASRTR